MQCLCGQVHSPPRPPHPTPAPHPHSSQRVPPPRNRCQHRPPAAPAAGAAAAHQALPGGAGQDSRLRAEGRARLGGPPPARWRRGAAVAAARGEHEPRVPREEAGPHGERPCRMHASCCRRGCRRRCRCRRCISMPHPLCPTLHRPACAPGAAAPAAHCSRWTPTSTQVRGALLRGRRARCMPSRCHTRPSLAAPASSLESLGSRQEGASHRPHPHPAHPRPSLPCPHRPPPLPLRHGAPGPRRRPRAPAPPAAARRRGLCAARAARRQGAVAGLGGGAHSGRRAVRQEPLTAGAAARGACGASAGGERPACRWPPPEAAYVR